MLMDEYLKGHKLYGDNFEKEQIEKWYEQEKEAYAGLVTDQPSSYSYKYTSMNMHFGFRFLGENEKFRNVLGVGSAFGEEFHPIISRVQAITILEPSDDLKSKKIGNVEPRYIKPNVSGQIDFLDNSFDLITCFGTLHHVPNVSFVLSEIVRVLEPGGVLLLREPIRTMGNWNYPRRGLTKNERGIPHSFFDEFFIKNNLKIVRKSFCESLWALRILKKLGMHYDSKAYVMADDIISRLFQWNIHYHSTSLLSKISPGSVFYVVQKIQP